MIGTPLVWAAGFGCPPAALGTSDVGGRVAAKPAEGACLRDGQRGVRVSADGDGEAEGKGEPSGDAEEEVGAGGDAVGPVVSGTVVSVVVARSGIVGGSACLGGIVSALVVSSAVVLPAASVSSDAMGSVRSAYGLAAGGISVDVPFGGV